MPIPATLGFDSVQNDNEFKKNPGVGGLVQLTTGYVGAPNVTATLKNASGVQVQTGITDADGWYMIPYKHTGKAATYRVFLPDGRCQQVALKANGFAEASFEYGVYPNPSPCLP